MDGDLPRRAIEFWFPGQSIDQWRAIVGGLSGARLWQFSIQHGAGSSQWALRRWPLGVSPRRVEEIHRVARHAIRAGCGFMPRYQTARGNGSDSSVVHWQGHAWDCAGWIRGAIPTVAPGPAGSIGAAEIVDRAARAIAQFHHGVADLETARGPAPSVLSRIERLGWLDRHLSSNFDRIEMAIRNGGTDNGLRGVLERASRLLRSRWTRGGLTGALAALDPWRAVPMRLQYVLRDVHVENCLFDGARLSGIVDLDAVRVDTPAADLSRLVGSVQMEMTASRSEKDALWQAAVAAYREQRAFLAEEEQLAAVLLRVNPLINLANWIVWLALEQRRFPASERTIEQRVDRWMRALADQEERGFGLA